MPRRPGQAALNPKPLSELKAGLGLDDGRESSGSGYEAESVCLPCLGMLQGGWQASNGSRMQAD